MTRRILGCAGALVVAGTVLTALGRAPQTPPAPPNAVNLTDFPTLDRSIGAFLQEGFVIKSVTRRLATEPDAIDTMSLLMTARRPDDAIAMLERITRTQPSQLAAALTAFSTAAATGSALRDGSKHYDQALRKIADSIRAAIPQRPREEAPGIARALVSFETYAGQPGSQPYRARLQAFVDAYPGTEEAELAQVNLLDDLAVHRVPQVLQSLDDFARAHAGTVVGAKALYTEAWELDHNAGSPPATPPGSDPTDRFFKMLAIVRELESGSFPACEWTTKAPSLVWEFYAYQPKYAPENVGRLLAAYAAFVKSHFNLIGENPVGSSLASVINNRMGALNTLKGGGVAGMQAIFDDLSAAVDPGAVRLIEASFPWRGLDGAAPGDQTSPLFRRSDDLFSAAANDRGSRWAQIALAELATRRLSARDLALAEDAFRDYVTRYPRSDWAWVAALRVAQLEAARGHVAEGAVAFRDVARTYADNPLAREIGSAYAGLVAEAAGHFAEALEDDRRALAGWDTDFGVTIRFPTPRVIAPDGHDMIIADDVDRQALTDRVTTLARTTALPGGMELERGRWLIAAQRWDDARRVLEPAALQNATSPLARELETLTHQARLGHALAVADVEAPGSDAGAASKELEALSTGRQDFFVSAAKVARSVLLWKDGHADEADALMRAGLDGWRQLQPTPAAFPAGSLERDVTDIRDVVFRPTGGGIYGAKGWNAFSWPASAPPFLVVNPDVTVVPDSGSPLRVTILQKIPSYENVLFLNRDQQQWLAELMLRLGGTKRRVPTGIMETPNQPAGPALDVLALLNRFFPARGGHWGGWEFATYPVITRIAFQNHDRTKATADVTVGYSGATVVLEKRDGAWIAVELTNEWIT